ncbi:hypothetical protein LDO26_07355 [Luteimonas sp. BDR2-5]|uniref:hypothetical protein n=1 Tax=Proluteimonas luteida TaxID=2878685 RepID=UPI001E4F40EE|nr:hypothetical protein [Luteimonas sp. BDR2-5]MCD9028023.1 hypothetical protein [Luteimonas sp. BDR2-5]
MLFDIRTAALDDLVEQRIRLAASLLGAYKLRARVSPWDGTRCHLLVAPIGDAYGRQALSRALDRHTPVIALGESGGDLPVEATSPNTPAAALAKRMHELLAARTPHAADASDETTQPAICRLAMPPLRGKAINARCDGRTLLLRPDLGRVYAASHSDLLAAADSLSGADWEMEVVEHPESTAGLVSNSIEAFLMRTAYRASDRLPDFPEGRYRLETWPDLGILPSLVGALQIAKLLIGKPMTVRELAQADYHNADARELNACLWAFAAADLLLDTEPRRPTVAFPSRQKRVQPGLWSSIARRFGLKR